MARKSLYIDSKSPAHRYRDSCPYYNECFQYKVICKSSLISYSTLVAATHVRAVRLCVRKWVAMVEIKKKKWHNGSPNHFEGPDILYFIQAMYFWLVFLFVIKFLAIWDIQSHRAMRAVVISKFLSMFLRCLRQTRLRAPNHGEIMVIVNTLS